MRAKHLASVWLAGCCSLGVACGGNSDGGSSTPNATLAGEWLGVCALAGNHVIELSLSIDQDGRISGDMFDTEARVRGETTGTCAGSTLAITYDFDDGRSGTGRGTMSPQGTSYYAVELAMLEDGETRAANCAFTRSPSAGAGGAGAGDAELGDAGGALPEPDPFPPAPDPVGSGDSNSRAGAAGSGGATPVSAVTPCDFWTNDRVVSWTAIADLPSATNALVAAPSTGAWYAATGSDFDGGAGVYVTQDRGATWTLTADGLTGEPVRAIAVCDDGETGLCVAVGNSVYRRALTADTWQLAAEDLTSTTGGFHALLSPPLDRMTVFGLAYEAVYRSDDGGRGWVRSDVGLPVDTTFTASAVSALAFDPSVATTVYAATGAEPVAGQGLFLSTDRGKTWGPLAGTNAPTSVQDLVVASDGTLFALAAGSLQRHDAGDDSWESLDARLPAGVGMTEPTRILVHEALPDAVFLLRQSLELVVSCDGGETFQTLVAAQAADITSFFQPPTLLVDAPDATEDDGVVLVVGTESSGAFRAVLR